MPDETPRTCRYGHGQLVQQGEHWSLDGRRIRPATEAEKANAPQLGDTIAEPTGQLFGVLLWRCPVCRYVELQDTE